VRNDRTKIGLGIRLESLQDESRPGISRLKANELRLERRLNSRDLFRGSASSLIRSTWKPNVVDPHPNVLDRILLRITASFALQRGGICFWDQCSKVWKQDTIVVVEKTTGVGPQV